MSVSANNRVSASPEDRVSASPEDRVSVAAGGRQGHRTQEENETGYGHKCTEVTLAYGQEFGHKVHEEQAETCILYNHIIRHVKD